VERRVDQGNRKRQKETGEDRRKQEKIKGTRRERAKKIRFLKDPFIIFLDLSSRSSLAYKNF
jgi:hypothetical protein